MVLYRFFKYVSTIRAHVFYVSIFMTVYIYYSQVHKDNNIGKHIIHRITLYDLLWYTIHPVLGMFYAYKFNVPYNGSRMYVGITTLLF